MLFQTFSHIPEAWQVAAAWHMKKDVNQALNIIHKALALHKHCKSFYTEAIQLEILKRDQEQADSSKTEKTDDKVVCEKIERYVQAIFDDLNDFEFVCDVLNQLDSHTFTKDLQDKIIKWLLDNYSDEEIVWHRLAQREKDGKNFTHQYCKVIY